MKATGIVRRIDDLGRVVIPKEIRRNLRIREGEPLEIFVDREGEIILKKYSPIGELGSLAREYAAAINETINRVVLILDRDSVIAAAGVSEKDFLGKGIGRFVERSMEERRSLLFNYDKDKADDGGVIDDETVTIYLVNPKAPCFIRDDEENYTYLILPVNINQNQGR